MDGVAIRNRGGSRHRVATRSGRRILGIGQMDHGRKISARMRRRYASTRFREALQRSYPAMRRKFSPSLVLFCCGLMLASIASSAGVGEALGPGDSVRVTVFEHPDLATETTISGDGTLAFPLLGEVQVNGRTPIEAGRLIADRLKQRKMVLDPQVSVTVVSVRSRQVAVLGQVAKPGNYPLEPGTTRVTDLLAVAGGISATGDGKVVVVTNRGGQSKRVEVDVPAMYKTGDLSANLEL